MDSQPVHFEIWTNTMATITLAVITLSHLFNYFAKPDAISLPTEP
jgi:hypothetical protein